MWKVDRVRCNPSSIRHSDILRKIDTEPYLTWVDEGERSKTIDPSAIPKRSYKRRKILIMSSTYLTGGAEMMAVNMAKALRGRHDVFLWAQTSGNYSIHGNIKVYEGNPVSIAIDNNVDIVIYNNGASIKSEDEFKSRYKKAKTVLCLHGLVKWTVNQFIGNISSIRGIDSVWAFSRVAGAIKMLGYNNSPAYELHCPVDGSRFKYSNRVWTPPFHIGYIGRVSPEKNLCGVLSLWKKIYMMMGGMVKFHFIGGLDPTNNDQNYTRWLGPVLQKAKESREWEFLKSVGALEDHGHVPSNKIPDIVRNLHLLTLASDFEGEPVVFTESMSSGCLCSYRDVGEVGQQLTGNGILTKARSVRISPEEIEEMAYSIRDTLYDEEKCKMMSRIGRDKFDKRHNYPNWVSNFENMMEDIICGQNL